MVMHGFQHTLLVIHQAGVNKIRLLKLITTVLFGLAYPCFKLACYIYHTFRVVEYDSCSRLVFLYYHQLYILAKVWMGKHKTMEVMWSLLKTTRCAS